MFAWSCKKRTTSVRIFPNILKSPAKLESLVKGRLLSQPALRLLLASLAAVPGTTAESTSIATLLAEARPFGAGKFTTRSLNAVVLGQEFGEQLRAVFERDLAQSDAVALEQ